MASVQIRYLVNDVSEAITFYCQHLGFTKDMHPSPAFAMLSRGELRLVLSQPNPAPGGGQPMPDGRAQQPGGWNRFSIELSDLAGTVDRLRRAGVRFRNEIVTGVGGKQILAEDPSGNPIELFEPILPEARLGSSSRPNKQTVEKYMESFRQSDHAGVLACLTDDVEWEVPGWFKINGKPAFDREIENPAFVGRPDIRVTRLTEENDVVIAEGSVRSQKADGGTLNAVFCDVFEMHQGKIRRLISYLMELKASGSSGAP